MLLRTSEKRGLITLCIILIGFFILPTLFKPKDNPFILIAQSEFTDTLSSTPKIQTPPPLIELNTVDSNGLLQIRGIGPYYASKILKYRRRLGGFHSLKQLKEIQFQYLNIDSLLPLFRVDPRHICKQDMDTMHFKAVLRHPYLTYEDVRLIFNAKRKWGKVNYSLLEEKKVLSPDKLKRIKPYFK